MKPFGPPSAHIKSRDYSSAVRGKPLDDATIERYIRAGRYGEERRLALLEAEKKPTKKQRKVARRAALADILKELLS